VVAAVGYASVQARVRARRSRLLDEAAWKRLLSAADPLRTLEDTALTSSLHRGGDLARTERALRRRVHLETLTLANDAPRRARDLLRWYASRYEVQDVKLLIRALHHGRSVQAAIDAMTRAPQDGPAVEALTRVRSMPELLGALSGSPYGRALDDAWERYQAERRPFYLEVALDLAFQRGLVDRIEALGGADRADAEALLGRWLARRNLLAAVRYRALAGVSAEEVVNFCLHRDFGDGLRMVQRVAAGAPLLGEAAALGIELSPEASERVQLLELERASDASRREAAHLRFARSPFGLGLVLAYLIALEAQSDDLVRLLEGKAQGMDDEALRARISKGAR
jgi:V/A-type H+-transporting ATPase subunit C